MTPDRAFIQRILDAGFVLVRQRKHLVFRRSDGKKLIIGCTPSDGRRYRLNVLRDLRRLGATS